MSNILVIDCNYLCHRARHTTGPLRYKRTPTGIVYGFLQQTFMLIQTTRPDNVVFTWDSKQSKRREFFPEYKAKRKNSNDDPKEIEETFQQFDLIRERLLDELGFYNNFMQIGYEADDIIAELCSHVHHDVLELIIASADDDLLQLLDKQICIYNMNKRKYYTDKDFIQDYGIDPFQWVDVKKLAGCSSDNVPGIPGVGEKTAIKFLKGKLTFGTKIATRILSDESKQIQKRNDYLVRLPLPGTDHVEIVQNEFRPTKMRNICKEFGFQKWLNDTTWIDDWDILLNK